MGLFTHSSLACIAIFVISLSVQHISATDTNTPPKKYIIRVDNDFKPAKFSDVEEWYRCILKKLNTNLNNELLHVYKTVFHGFCTNLTPTQVQNLRNLPGILRVYEDRVLQLQITRSPEFLGLRLPGSVDLKLDDLYSRSDYGSDVIIGMLDGGIWPERRSFNDKDLGPIPSKWKGQCQLAKDFPTTLCNKKLIGARYFSSNKNESISNLSPRDYDGHGTHTASTAAGREIKNASFLGYAAGTAVGIAPKARLAAYKVCGLLDCSSADILAAFDKAVEDGVDVISISLGGPDELKLEDDVIAIGSFGAVDKGVVVSASAGNSGPSLMTVTNLAPWSITVGAGTIDRTFPVDLVLGNGRILTGKSLYRGENGAKNFLPLIYAGNASLDQSTTCAQGKLPKSKTRGKIVVCDYGDILAAQKGVVVQGAGGAGVVVANVEGMDWGLQSEPFFGIPGVGLNQTEGHILLEYLSSSKNPTAKMVFRGTLAPIKPAPMVAAFSSRGPNMVLPYIMKPDVIAPGLDILAAWTGAVSPSGVDRDTRRTEFNILSGTSMAAPHVSGVVALLRGAHPEWSPAMIKSAIMTTAYTRDANGNILVDEKDNGECTTLDMGAGHVAPVKALDPGLIYDLSTADYLDFLCASNYSEKVIQEITHRKVKCNGQANPWDINYPSISVFFRSHSGAAASLKVKRTVTNVDHGAANYTVKISSPEGISIRVDPTKLEFKEKGEKQSYVVTIQKRGQVLNTLVATFGQLEWTDGSHHVTSPITILLHF